MTFHLIKCDIYRVQFVPMSGFRTATLLALVAIASLEIMPGEYRNSTRSLFYSLSGCEDVHDGIE